MENAATRHLPATVSVSGQQTVGVTYWPATAGPYLWHAFDAERIAADFARLREHRLTTVRVLLAWDAFMPSPDEVSRYRLRDLEKLLVLAAQSELSVVPVLFAQSLGDCIMLPAFAVDRNAARRGVRVVSDGRVEPGGPRDMYSDPLMLELAERWLEALLDAFANHPAIAAWDLGQDPATTMRPRRIAELSAWVRAMAERVHTHGDPCWLTLGAGDVFVARGVRLGAVSPHLDALGLHVLPQTLPFGVEVTNSDAVIFAAQLAQRLAGGSTPMLLSTGVATQKGGTDELLAETREQEGQTVADRRDVEPASEDEAARYSGELLERLSDAGVGGAMAWTWSDVRPRAWSTPPFDRFPSLARHGLLDAAGHDSPALDSWSALAASEAAAPSGSPWPPDLDVAEYYANLPDSARDLLSGWRRVTGVDAAILE